MSEGIIYTRLSPDSGLVTKRLCIPAGHETHCSGEDLLEFPFPGGLGFHALFLLLSSCQAVHSWLAFS